MQQKVYQRHIDNEKKHWWFSARREILSTLLKDLNSRKNLSILDFGSGSGTNIEMLEKFGKVYVYEKNQKAKDYLKSKFKKKKKIEIIKKPLRKKYDLIIAADVLEHIENDKKAISDLNSFLKKNGYLLITVPAFSFLFSTKDTVLKHFRRYNKSNLNDLLKKNFYIKKLSYFNFFLFFPIVFSILILKIKKTKFISYAETTPFFPINFLLKYIFGLEKFFLRFLNFPFGISIIALVQKR